MQKKLYYAHSINLYWTEQEDDDLGFLSQGHLNATSDYSFFLFFNF